jgi:O-antigen/teichoic acid export membrane protein
MGKGLQQAFIYYTALILNIFLGWIVVKINTTYLDLAGYGRYSFFIIVLYFSRSFFGFGFFESTSRLLAVTPDTSGHKDLLGTGIICTLGFSILFTFFFVLSSFFSDHIFNVKIGDLCLQYSLIAGIILIHSYYLLAFRGTGQIGLLSLITIAPRIFYIFFLVLLVWLNRFTLNQSLNMFFLATGLVILVTTLYIEPYFKNWLSTVSRLWQELKSYGVHLYLSTIWNEILFHADKFIISFFLSAQSMAHYALGYALTFPLTHFSTSIATAMFNRFALQSRISFRVIRVNLFFVIISVLVFIFLRKLIIVNLFSNDYLPTVEIMLPLALAFGFSGLSKPFTLFLMARGDGKTVRNISIFIPSVHIITGILVIPSYGILGAAWTAAGIYLLDLLLFLLAYRRFTSNRFI